MRLTRNQNIQLALAQSKTPTFIHFMYTQHDWQEHCLSKLFFKTVPMRLVMSSQIKYLVKISSNAITCDRDEIMHNLSCSLARVYSPSTRKQVNSYLESTYVWSISTSSWNRQKRINKLTELCFFLFRRKKRRLVPFYLQQKVSILNPRRKIN